MVKFKAATFLQSGDRARIEEIQSFVRGKVRIAALPKVPEYVAGVDASFLDETVIAVATLWRLPEMRQLETAFFRGETDFPYMPGLLSFREGPAVVNAVRKLTIVPDLVLVDGHGIAHPRGAGLAAYVGVILNIPTVGCAKSRLIGNFIEPGREKGQWTYLYRGEDRNEPIGAVLRTRRDTRPVFVSPGHLIDIGSSVAVVMQCTSGYRIPEPLRKADSLSRVMKRDETLHFRRFALDE